MLYGHQRDGEPEPFNIRPARTEADLDAVHRLVYRAYRERGYCGRRRDGRLRYHAHYDRIPGTIVLMAIKDGRLVGTHSLTADGDWGLPFDEDFTKECGSIRLERRRLGAFWRLATVPEFRGSRQLLFELFRSTLPAVLKLKLQTCLCALNPRHERVYRKLLHLRTVGLRKCASGLMNAPAILMRWDQETGIAPFNTKLRNVNACMERMA